LCNVLLNTLFSIILSTELTERRVVFTSQTPSKRQKLTYEKIPGRRGQTKLVFK